MAQLTRFRSVVVAGLALAAGLLPAAPAAAQNYNFLGNLFGGGFPRAQPYAPSYPGGGGGGGGGYNYGYGAGDTYTPRRRPSTSYYEAPARPRPFRRKPAEVVQQREAPPREKAPVPKNASLFVGVYGDSLALALANGLDDSFAERADVLVVHKGRAGLGLAQAGSFDWAKEIGEGAGRPDPAKAGVADAGKTDSGKTDAGKTDAAKADAPKADAAKPDAAKRDGKAAKAIDVAVMMIGTADRQPLTVEGKVLQPGTPEWNAAYARRVLDVAELFRARKVSLVWVGVPIAKDDDFADAMAGLNEIYKDVAAKTGAIFVDTWAAFSDDGGDFSASGPDINGQTVRLRAADGVNFTKAGARKLAHFVEAHVTRALEGKTPAPQQPPEASDKDGKPVAAAKPDAGRPDAGRVRNLPEAPSAKSGTLATAGARPRPADGAPTPGPAVATQPGRADNAHWTGNLDDP